MADMFGDLDLFSEFDKDREAQGSFIHYDEETVRSRIVFEDYADDEDNESEDDESKTDCDRSGEHDTDGQQANAAANQKGYFNCAGRDTGDSDESSFHTSEKRQIGEDGDLGLVTKVSDQERMSSTNGVKKETERQVAAEDVDKTSTWLNEQLYSEAAEEAKNVNSSTQQLIYERNKFRRYARILDSTRYVPDDESPAVQLIFNNNSFARKYRQQIEQFIKGLLWEEFNSTSQDSVPEVTAKPGVPSCIDINTKLPPEKRAERMRQKHALIGSSQFHKQFLIDFLGWPFTVAEPTRCNVNWEIPLYNQVFNEVYADPVNKLKKPQSKKQKQSCWNCGEENHAVSECKHPRNQAKITANRKEFMAQQQQNSEPKFTGPSRYHLDPDLGSRFSKFKPGVISEALRQALGLTTDQLPQHIYKMRLFGYPPGWLAEARQVQSGVSIFDKNGRVTLITGECLEDGELEEDRVENKTEYDVNKIIEYPGFTVPVPLGFMDEHSTFKMPPIQQHQLKKTLMTQTTGKTSKKRKREKHSDEHADIKKVKSCESGQDDGEIPATSNEGEEESSKILENENGLEESLEENSPMAAPSSNRIPQALPRSSSTISLSRDFGTPVIEREKPGLPDASKFGQGIEEHIPFENLPNSTGTFEKMRDLIETIRNKSKK